MSTLLFSDPVFRRHDTSRGHPECPERVDAVLDALSKPDFGALQRRIPSPATVDRLASVHERRHVEAVLQAIPAQGHAFLDGDTCVSPDSGNAALCGAGAVCEAVDEVAQGRADTAFCAVRPPGHHATADAAMGFCLFNNAAVAAAHALNAHGMNRVAILDFDVHHGNGTQDIVWSRPGILYVSSHQSPLYPGTGRASERGGSDNIVNMPLPPNSGSTEMRDAYGAVGLPALEAFQPDLIILSAGFDAHRLDPLAGLNWTEDDYAWLTRRVLDIADRLCGGRVVSTLEGGYHLGALGNSVAGHVRALMGASNSEDSC
jgi:acetoin utilization deacetylase AcuC-like enzyme